MKRGVATDNSPMSTYEGILPYPTYRGDNPIFLSLPFRSEADLSGEISPLVTITVPNGNRGLRIIPQGQLQAPTGVDKLNHLSKRFVAK